MITIVLDAIAGQIHENLFQPRRITKDRQRFIGQVPPNRNARSCA